MIKLKLITRIFQYPYHCITNTQSFNPLLSNIASYYSSTNSLSKIIHNTNLQLLNPNNAKVNKSSHSNSKQSLKNGNGHEIDSTKLSEDLKTTLEGVLERFNTHQLKLIKTLNAASIKSSDLLRQKFNDKDSSQYQKLVYVRNETKEVKKIVISSIEISNLECLKSIEDYIKEELEKKTTENAKAKNQAQKGRGLLLKIFQKIKEEIQQILSKQKAEIEKMVKIKGQSYLERVRLNKKEENDQWFDQNFLNVYRKDLKEIRNVVQDSGGEFCLKINDMIVRAESVETKKKYAKIQSK